MSHPNPPRDPPAPIAPASPTLRHQAEAQWQAIRQKTPDIFGDLTLRDTDILTHDLHVHQIELDLQNEELRRARDALAESRERYFDLYDLAPVGYCSVNEGGLITQANLTLANMLGLTRIALTSRLFSSLVIAEDQNSWCLLRRQLLVNKPTEVVELRLRLSDSAGHGHATDTGACLWVQLSTRLVQDEFGANLIHVAVSDISVRKLAEGALHASEARFRTLFEASQDAVLLHRDGKVIFANPTAAAMFGARSDNELVGKAVMALVHPDHAPVVQARINKALALGQVATALDGRFVRLDGTVFDAETQGRSISLDGLPTILVTLRDIAERKAAQARLQLAASVFGHAREGITITDAQGTIVDVNEAFTRVTGYSREEAIGQNPRILKSGRQDQAFYEAMWVSLMSLGYWSGEIWNRRKSGEVYASLLTINAVRDASGSTLQYVGMFSDITAIKAHQIQLEHMAHFDALTNLPNRLLLADRLQQAMAQVLRRQQQLAVVYIDLDGFKSINDHHGHDVGDQMLIALTQAMKDGLREGDTLARIGGDEFVAVLVDLDNAPSSALMLTRLLAAAAAPVQLGERLMQSSASMGVTFYPQAKTIEADQLLRQADQAMYEAKVAGKNRYQVFDAEHDSLVRGHHESLEHIRQALGQDEFVLYYQPKVNMRSGQLVGVEALIRWQHPDKGLLSPAAFLPVIEDHPLAVAVGEWVLDTALTQMESWHSAGLNLPVSVNVGARQLQQADFLERLQGLLAAHPQVSPTRLTLEVLETSALADMAQVSQVIDDCARIGVMFALDDFGTGYSSLTYLKRLRVALLKIDQSFVRDMLEDPDDLAILQGVIGLAAAFKREVIAEGVETVAHGTALLHLGCELVFNCVS